MQAVRGVADYVLIPDALPCAPIQGKATVDLVQGVSDPIVYVGLVFLLSEL